MSTALGVRGASTVHPLGATAPRRPDVSPRLAALIDAARELAWQPFANVCGLRYYERRDAMNRLRGCLAEYDREVGDR